ncbi:MAG TPA: PQQ-dependent sugar dehydrogenase [Gemmatimonadaceae bacterium]|nr:PQQ-dependent sugar dehydrogenase [Gemmatimonadaceae bacterium]
MRVRRTFLAAVALVATLGCNDYTTDPGSSSLVVNVLGLPAGANAAIQVTGPGNFSQAVTATTTIEELQPGTYTIEASSLIFNGTTFLVTPASQEVEVLEDAQASATVNYTAAAALTLRFAEVVSGLSNPVYLTAPAGDTRLFIVQQDGRIRIVQNGTIRPTDFLNLSSRTDASGERGLLSMAFHPQYSTNGFFFVYFTESGTGDILVERYHVSTDPNVSEPAGTLVLRIAHRDFSNHNGGLLLFGPDGMLYMGTGDGGGGGDPLGNGQNLSSLLGKLLRIDVTSLPYTIPAGNPFAGQPNRRGEIWAYGLRNPWRFAFDRGANELYIADVGQNDFEEVNVVNRTTAGVNYGWNIMEGLHCFPIGTTNCNQSGLTLPVLEYDHSQGCSIAGGFVYRGTQLPELVGHYFYSDLCRGWLRTFRFTGGAATEHRDWGVLGAVGATLSFGEDAAGELYVLSGNGSVYRIVRQ